MSECFCIGPQKNESKCPCEIKATAIRPAFMKQKYCDAFKRQIQETVVNDPDDRDFMEGFSENDVQAYINSKTDF